MHSTQFNGLLKSIKEQGLEDGGTIYAESGEVFNPDRSDWDAEGLVFILKEEGIDRHTQLTDAQYASLLTAYGQALTEGGRNAQ